MQVRAILLAAALTLTPFTARAADLVVWWEESFYPEEDAAIRETAAVFEQKTASRSSYRFTCSGSCRTNSNGNCL
jgi:hypothetical protein